MISGIIGIIFIVLLLGTVQVGCHFEAKSLGQTRKQRRAWAKDAERRRLFWSIRDLEKDVLGIDWCGPNAR